jgi:hypothetical protein
MDRTLEVCQGRILVRKEPLQGAGEVTVESDVESRARERKRVVVGGRGEILCCNGCHVLTLGQKYAMVEAVRSVILPYLSLTEPKSQCGELQPRGGRKQVSDRCAVDQQARASLVEPEPKDGNWGAANYCVIHDILRLIREGFYTSAAVVAIAQILFEEGVRVRWAARAIKVPQKFP